MEAETIQGLKRDRHRLNQRVTRCVRVLTPLVTHWIRIEERALDLGPAAASLDLALAFRTVLREIGEPDPYAVARKLDQAGWYVNGQLVEILAVAAILR